MTYTYAHMCRDGHDQIGHNDDKEDEMCPVCRELAKLERIADIYETRRKNDDGTYTTNHARHNLEGALYDLERQGADPLCLRTIRRVIEQLASIESVLELEP